jgi:hypothetical protein
VFAVFEVVAELDAICDLSSSFPSLPMIGAGELLDGHNESARTPNVGCERYCDAIRRALDGAAKLLLLLEELEGKLRDEKGCNELLQHHIH